MSTAMNVNKFWRVFCNELIYKSISVDFFMLDHQSFGVRGILEKRLKMEKKMHCRRIFLGIK